MTSDNEQPSGPAIFQVAVCGVCDALFLMSGRRETSPCHGSDPILVVATLEVQPDGGVAGTWGAGAPIGEGDITEEPEAPAAPPGPAAAAEESGAPPPAEETEQEIFPVLVGDYFDSGPTNEGILRESLEAMGAEAEVAATAVGRLRAVRELIQGLRETGVPVTVGVSAEETPPEAPGPPSAPESAPEPS